MYLPLFRLIFTSHCNSRANKKNNKKLFRFAVLIFALRKLKKECIMGSLS